MASGDGGVAVPMRDAGDDDQDTGPTLHIEATDVIKVVLQYLRESGLSNAADVLSTESGVSLNSVPSSVEAFRDDVAAGRWSDVLPLAAAMRLPRRKLEALYEQVALELCEAGEGDTARALLNGSAVLRGMRDREREREKRKKKTAGGGGFRYARLESAVFAATSANSSSSSSTKGVDPALLWGGGVTVGVDPRALRDARRAALADSLASEVVAPPPGRLLTLLGQALRYHHHLSSSPSPSSSSKRLPRLVFGPYDLLLGAAAASSSGAAIGAAAATAIDADAPPSASRPLLKLLKFGTRSHPEAACFSPDGTTLATGSADGFIELWHARDDGGIGKKGNANANAIGTLRDDLVFQKEDNFMSHDSAILSLAWSPDSAMIASGDKGGCIKVWRASTGLCLRRMEGAHSAGVTALAFAPPSSSTTEGEKTGDGAGAGFSSSSTSAHLLSASYDGTARVHGLRSGRVLKELTGHGSYVTCASWATRAVRSFGSSFSSPSDAAAAAAAAAPSSSASTSASAPSRLLFGGKRAIVTGSADGAVRYWDASTGECLSTVVPPAIRGGGASSSGKEDDGGDGGDGGGAAAASASASPPAVVSVLPHPRRPGLVVAATRSPGIHLLSFAPPQSERGAKSTGDNDDEVILGATLRSVPTGKGRGRAGGDAVALSLSQPSGKWAMMLAEDGCLYCFLLPVEASSSSSSSAAAGAKDAGSDSEDDDDGGDDDEGDEGPTRKKNKRQAAQKNQKTDAEFAAAVSLERVVPVVVDRSSSFSSAAAGAGAPSAVDEATAAAAASLQKATETGGGGGGGGGGGKPAAAAPSLAKKHAPAASLASVPIGVCVHPWSQVTATWSADGELRLWEGERAGDDDDDKDDDDDDDDEDKG